MATLNLEVLFKARDELTGPIKAIIGGSNDLGKAFKQTNSHLKSLQDQQRRIGRFNELRDGLEKTNASLEKHKQTINDLKQQAKLGPLTQEQVTALGKAEAAVKRLNSTYKNQSQEITATVQELNKAGISVDRLADHESELKDKILQTTMELNKRRDALNNAKSAQEKFAKTQEQLKKAAGYAQTGLMVAGASAAAMSIPVKLSIDFESAMADVKKVVDFETPQQFKQMENDIISMSSRLPMAAKDIAAIYAAGGQSGIAKNELSQFAETAVKMGVAFDISAAESGQAMAEMRTAFKMSQDEVTTLADKINYLGNNTPAAAKAIMEIVQRIGPLGEVGGFASGSIAALGATIRGMGVAEEVAATGIKNMMLALVAGESATKSQRNAYIDLGLDAEKVAQNMQKDAEGTTLSVLKAISKLDKYKQAAMLKDLFGSESLGSIAPLLTNMEALEANLNKVSDKTLYAASMEKEYAARAATTANNLQLAKNQVVAVGLTIGNILLPTVNNLIGKFSGIIQAVQNWTAQNPALTSTLVKVAVGAIAVIGGLSALALGVVTVLGPLAMLKMTMATLGGGAGAAAGALKFLLGPIKAIGLAFVWVGKLMLANPMILAITATVAVVTGAAYLIYKNWEPIKGFFGNVWAAVKNAFGEGAGHITAIWGNITKSATDLWASIKSAFATGVTFLTTSWKIITNSVSQLWGGVKDAFYNGFNFIKSIIQRIDTIFANNPILNFLIPLIGIPRIIIANWSSISTYFSEIWANISSITATGISYISGVINTGFNFIHSLNVILWTSISTFISSVWGGLRSIIGTGVTYISGVINTGFNFIHSLNVILWTSISTFISSVWGGLRSIIATGVTYISSLINTGFNYIYGFSSAIWNNIKNIVSTTWSALCNIFLAVTPLGYIIQNWNSIMSFLSGLQPKMLSIGNNIIQGLVDGIKSGFGKLKEIWNTVNSYMPDFAKKKMDIHSPSRVMAGIGGHIMGGMGVGIQGGMQNLKNQFNQALGIFNQQPTPPPVMAGSMINQLSPTMPPIAKTAMPTAGGRNITIINQDKIEIIVKSDATGGPLHHAAESVRKQLEEHERKRAEIQRRMLSDRE